MRTKKKSQKRNGFIEKFRQLANSMDPIGWSNKDNGVEVIRLRKSVRSIDHCFDQLGNWEYCRQHVYSTSAE